MTMLAFVLPEDAVQEEYAPLAVASPGLSLAALVVRRWLVIRTANFRVGVSVLFFGSAICETKPNSLAIFKNSSNSTAAPARAVTIHGRGSEKNLERRKAHVRISISHAGCLALKIHHHRLSLSIQIVPVAEP